MDTQIPDLGGFHMVVSIRQREIDRQFVLLHRRLPSTIKQIRAQLGDYSLTAALEPHTLVLLAAPGQRQQRAYLRVNLRLEQLRAQHRNYQGPQPWTVAYRVNLESGELQPEDWSDESLHLADEVKAHVRELKQWDELRIIKLYLRFTGERLRDHFDAERSSLSPDMSAEDVGILLDLLDEYYRASGLLRLQNILLASPVAPADYHYDDRSHVFWPSSLHHSITHNEKVPQDSTLNFMAMALHQPPPPQAALRDDDDPHGKLFYLPRFEGQAANMGGVLRLSQELSIIHGFIDSLNYMARLRSGQHQRNWPYGPAEQGRWGSTFTTLVRGQFRSGGTYEFRTMNAYNFVVDNFHHPNHGPCVRFQIGGAVVRIAAAGGLSTSARIEASLILYLTVDDGKNFYFHDDPDRSRRNHPLPEVVDERAYRAFRARTDHWICSDGAEFYTKSGPYLNLPGTERSIFNPAHWRNIATPVFMPDGNFVALRDPSLMYFRGYNNLRTHINYSSRPI